MFLGLIISAVLAQGSVVKSIGMVVFGVSLGMVGTDVQTGQQRFTFGIPELSDGVGFVSIAMGMFGIAEIILNLERPEARSVMSGKVGSLMMTREEFRRAVPAVLRGTAVGSMLGILPGGGAALSSFASYMMERKVSKGRHEFGTGAIEGVAGPEAANNAASQTSFIPLLTLGIPANAVMALMVGALIIQGIQPGPRMVEAQPDLFWGLIASMWLGNLMLLVINLPMVGIWVKLLAVPYRHMYPSIMIFCAIGVYSLQNNVFDVYQTVIFGIFGYLCSKLRLEAAPMLIGFVLGPMMEEHLRRAMLLSRGDPMVFIERPISATMLAIAFIALAAMLLPNIRKGKDSALAEGG
jgi:TctA family transporter